MRLRNTYIIVALGLISICCAGDAQADAAKRISKRQFAFVTKTLGLLKRTSTLMSPVFTQSFARSSDEIELPCSDGGSATLQAAFKNAAPGSWHAEGALKLQSCNALTGALNMSAVGQNVTSGQCTIPKDPDDKSRACKVVSTLVGVNLVGSVEQAAASGATPTKGVADLTLTTKTKYQTYSRAAILNGSFAIIRGSRTLFSCNWENVNLRNKEALKSACK